MQRITITLMNLYDADTSLLDNLVLPDQIDRDDFIGRLMIDIGESEVYITNPRIMRIAIGAWSRGRLPVWKRLAAILDTEYNPIWNVDGETTHTGSNTGSRSYGRQRGLSENDDYTRDRDQVETLNRTQGIDTAQNGTASGTSSETVSGTTGETITTDIDTTTSETETVTGQLSADNVESWSNDTKTDTVKSGSGTDDRTETKSGTSSENKSGQTSETTASTGSEDLEEHSTTTTAEDIADNRKRTETETFTDDESSTGADTWKEVRQGNIGVTTTQKMLTEEWAFWAEYDIIDYIIKQFAEEFCLMVY